MPREQGLPELWTIRLSHSPRCDAGQISLCKQVISVWSARPRHINLTASRSLSRVSGMLLLLLLLGMFSPVFKIVGPACALSVLPKHIIISILLGMSYSCVFKLLSFIPPPPPHAHAHTPPPPSPCTPTPHPRIPHPFWSLSFRYILPVR